MKLKAFINNYRPKAISRSESLNLNVGSLNFSKPGVDMCGCNHEKLEQKFAPLRQTAPLVGAFDERSFKIDNRLTLNLEAVMERSFEDIGDASHRNDMTGGAFRKSINILGPNEELGFGTKVELGKGVDGGVCGDCGKQVESVLGNLSSGLESIHHPAPRKSVTNPEGMKTKLAGFLEDPLGQG